MSIERMTQLGNINITKEAIAELAGGVVTECYGVVGMASQKFLKDGFAELLGMENFTKGVVVNKTDQGFEIDLYVVLSYGVKISEIVLSVQKKVKYMLEKSLEQTFVKVNVFVQGVKVEK
ncbi:MAG TPA: Asp23/Gls24 family envelope stress response protein [Erysipelothrix sp.]|nr:Asp23/Gls24 family envelope stress response protein [Erysipelothrix sp.]